MDPSQLLREARRHAGYSQRELAAVSGVSLRTVADGETGRRRLSAAVLDALLTACGLDLTLCPRSEGAGSDELRAHLRLSTTERLRKHVGCLDGGPPSEPVLWQELMQLAAHAAFVLLDGPDAVGVWVPGLPVLHRVEVGLSDAWRPRPLPAATAVRVRWLGQRRGGWGSRSAVRVALPNGGAVAVPPPAELLLDPQCDGHSESLRAAARCLHQGLGRDDADRRAPAHRDPDELEEGRNLSRSLTYAMDSCRLPDPTDSRGWRLDGPVSLRQWHEENGHPPRRGSRRRE